MRHKPTAIPEVVLIEPTVHGDDRGFFFEAWNKRLFAETAGVDVDFVQDNHSSSVQHVLRGLHYQLEPHAQGKLVRVARGKVFDVAVDLRHSSPTFGKWVGEELSAENRHQLWIPPGFAHGFLAMSPVAELLYKTTDYYDPALDRSLAWNDERLAIDWPLGGAEPILSDKDRSAPPLAAADLFD